MKFGMEKYRRSGRFGTPPKLNEEPRHDEKGRCRSLSFGLFYDVIERPAQETGGQVQPLLFFARYIRINERNGTWGRSADADQVAAVAPGLRPQTRGQNKGK